MPDAKDTSEASKAKLLNSRIHVVFDVVRLRQPNSSLLPT
jgi:hypothetical protein